MRGIVLLCTQKNSTDSEEFYNAEVQKVKVSIEGNPNAIYSKGLVKSEIYNEAQRFFGMINDTCNDNLSTQELYKNKYAIVIDLRTVDDEAIVGSGRRLVGAQSGVLQEIERLETVVDLMCHVFVISDALVYIANNKLQKIEY